MSYWKKLLGCLGCVAVFILGIVAGWVITQKFYLPETSERLLETGEEGQPSLRIDQFIDEVKTALEEAQKKYKEEQKGPPFLVKDFDLEVHVELAESQQVEGKGEVKTPPTPSFSLQVATSKSSGTTHLVKLHFESALYDIAKQVIEECARQYIPPVNLFTTLEGQLEKPIEKPPLQMQKELIEKLEKAEEGFFDCINNRMPPDARPLSSIIHSFLQVLKEKLK